MTLGKAMKRPFFYWIRIDMNHNVRHCAKLMKQIVADVFGDFMALNGGQLRVDGNDYFRVQAMSNPAHTKTA